VGNEGGGVRSLQLESALSAYLEAAAGLLQADVAAGAEVALEVGSTTGRRGATPLYSYRPLTGAFIDEREGALRALPAYAEAARLLEGFDGLERYLTARGGEIASAKGRARARVALRALLEDVFAEQTDFQLHPERMRGALERLDGAALAGPNQLALVATLHGIQISSPELQLAKGLMLAQPQALDGMPDAVRACAGDARAPAHLLALHTGEDDDPAAALERGREVLRELLRALRLFGDGRVSLGALAWACVGSGQWSPLALGGGGRPHGMLVVALDQEDELRAFCSLVSRRAPKRDELAWALRRFELGCDRESAQEALTDHVLALRALLEPEGAASAMLAGRLAALCATPGTRAELAERVAEALELERAIAAGSSVKQPRVRALYEELAGHLRALLSDVVCGHLDGDLVRLADELLLATDAPAGGEDGDADGDEFDSAPDGAAADTAERQAVAAAR
jgi:hypothetical protein